MACRDSPRTVSALKICIADADPKHELEIFNQLSSTSPAPPNVLQLLDHFSLQGPNGVHTILVLNVLGKLLDHTKSLNGPGPKLVRTLCHDLAVGLAALHRRGIVHGDLHAGNVGIFLPDLNNHPASKILNYFGQPECTIVLPTTHPGHLEALPQYLVPPISVVDYLIANDKNPFDGPLRAEIMDLGNATIVDKQSLPICTPAAVCAPELVFDHVSGARVVRPGSQATKASDVWSLGCTIYELVFGGSLFHFAGQNDTLLGKMAMLCGEVPDGWKGYWESREGLHSLSVSHEIAEAEWNRRLKQLTGYPEGDANKEMTRLLRSMLTIDPTRRPSAEEVLNHPWFCHDGTAEMQSVP